MKDIEFRPIPVSQIKNNLIRRILIIISYIPILIVGLTVHLSLGLLWTLIGVCSMPFVLIKNGIKYWDKPRNLQR